MANGFAGMIKESREMHDADRHLTIAELATRKCVPVNTVRKWNATGTGPRFMKIGRYVRYRPADVIAWEESRYADGGSGDAA
jgi:predicted DNA-binding transcriptional regulator AlpA